MTTKNLLLTLFLASLLGGVVVGCGSSSESTGEAPAPGTTAKTADAPPARAEK